MLVFCAKVSLNCKFSKRKLRLTRKLTKNKLATKYNKFFLFASINDLETKGLDKKIGCQNWQPIFNIK